MSSEQHHAECLCGAVQIKVTGPLGPPDACHCSQCRRQSGHYWASTNVAREHAAITGADNLTWYHSSENVRRGVLQDLRQFPVVGCARP